MQGPPDAGSAKSMIRVTVYKAVGFGKPCLEQGKAVMVCARDCRTFPQCLSLATSATNLNVATLSLFDTLLTLLTLALRVPPIYTHTHARTHACTHTHTHTNIQVPDTWHEFLLAAARKVNSPRVASVETLDTGTVLEELDEIMHGDKLVIRCPPFAALQSAPATRSLPTCMYMYVHINIAS